MKKMLILVALSSLLITTVKSQIASTFKSSSNLVADTVIDAGTKYLIAKIGGSYAYCSASVTLTNISGTTAATVTLQHSTDGSKWYAVSTDSVLTFAAAGTQGVIWNGYRDTYLRWKIVGSGTQHSRVEGSFSFR